MSVFDSAAQQTGRIGSKKKRMEKRQTAKSHERLFWAAWFHIAEWREQEVNALKSQRGIGSPIKERALTDNNCKRIPRMRVDLVTRQIVSWFAFQQKHSTTTDVDLIVMWKSLPRVKRPARERWFEGESMTWDQCVHRFRDYYEMSSLYTWYTLLPRAE